jgi:hypothetical protein
MLAVGAVGAQAVQQYLNSLGHDVVELERGSLATRIWRDVKRKRVRIPDLCCTLHRSPAEQAAGSPLRDLRSLELPGELDLLRLGAGGDAMTRIDSTTPFQTLPTPVYSTRHGACFLGDSLALLQLLPDDCVDLIVTSPPFALLRQKAYGNKDQSEYVDWLCRFGVEARRVLRETGSFVLDLGGAYQRGVPVRSLYQYRVLLKMCDEVGFYLAEEFFWHNPAKLPSPIEWVNKRKLRAKDSVNTV